MSVNRAIDQGGYSPRYDCHSPSVVTMEDMVKALRT